MVLAQEKLLKKIAEDPTFRPSFESPEHHIRFSTLQEMAKMYSERA